ncbi:uncharacterized protein LOC115627537 isoform X1 [Scaptodrosophila lebanonensis]|uniref:Uncharacterized protein LOC115627537 isoform X1 n=1 Tax=Drosophila lebanonensis TaxID=7225 RepID=A0A6J2TR07_DROLE|nr:uncharacterized protein LOC115627537 isoform X1 [Scaptodrosophila lebanonensis]XP_030379101.1 uncharacterized protein LOC115627537 isoform X1 [Scaptodrosophila lebanonensis]XP_030379102.1 uncharacterized protein LOC115627537 isoform X1 [Scaptodrosophila lebanonensis]
MCDKPFNPFYIGPYPDRACALPEVPPQRCSPACHLKKDAQAHKSTMNVLSSTKMQIGPDGRPKASGSTHTRQSQRQRPGHLSGQGQRSGQGLRTGQRQEHPQGMQITEPSFQPRCREIPGTEARWNSHDNPW